jgi:hypothetical protein
MKYHRYDVPDDDVFNVFYHTITTFETETDFSMESWKGTKILEKKTINWVC